MFVWCLCGVCALRVCVWCVLGCDVCDYGVVCVWCVCLGCVCEVCLYGVVCVWNGV